MLNIQLVVSNTAKSSQGDAPDCNADPLCDGVSNEVNAEHMACGKYSNTDYTLCDAMSESGGIFH